jgi:hypothetical protein
MFRPQFDRVGRCEQTVVVSKLSRFSLTAPFSFFAEYVQSKVLSKKGINFTMAFGQSRLDARFVSNVTDLEPDLDLRKKQTLDEYGCPIIRSIGQPYH